MRLITTPRLEIATEEYGEARDALTCVLVHGFPDYAGAWQAVGARLAAQGLRCLAPNLSGVGATRFRDPRARRSGQQATLGRDLLDLLDAEGIDRAVLVGHDWGSSAVLAAAALAPDRVAGLVVLGGYLLIDPAAGPLGGVLPAPATAQAMWYQWFLCLEVGRAALTPDPGALATHLWRTWSLEGSLSDEALQQMLPALLNPDYAEVVTHFYRQRRGLAPGDADYANDERALAALPVIEPPAMLLSGGADPIIPPAFVTASQAKFGHLLDTVLLPGVGHFPHREDPAAVAAAVTRIANGER